MVQRHKNVTLAYGTKRGICWKRVWVCMCVSDNDSRKINTAYLLLWKCVNFEGFKKNRLMINPSINGKVIFAVLPERFFLTQISVIIHLNCKMKLVKRAQTNSITNNSTINLNGKKLTTKFLNSPHLIYLCLTVGLNWMQNTTFSSLVQLI